MTEQPTPHADLNALLRDFVAGLRAALGADLVGVYLQGSFATGGHDAHSDVDWVAVTRAELTPAQVAALRTLHAALHDRDLVWAKRLEGSYFPLATLQAPPQADDRLWYLDNGSRDLVRSEHCNTLVVRATLQRCGITLTGQPAAALLDPVPVADLRAEMLGVMHGWGAQILADPAAYRNQFYQRFIVDSFARMLCDAAYGTPGSKVRARNWASTHLDPQWVDLIAAAAANRDDPAHSVRQAPDPAQFERTLAFVRYALAQG